MIGYENGTWTSPIDGLQKFAAFIAANGWTIQSSISDGSGWRLHASKDGVYVNIRAAVNETAASSFDDRYDTRAWSGFALYLGDGYSSGSTWKAQPGGPVNSGGKTLGVGSFLPSGSIVAYHFFSDPTGDNIDIVVERSSGIFSHVGFGTSLSKVGSWTGGPYFFGAISGLFTGSSSTSNYPSRAQSAPCPGAYGDSLLNACPVCFVRADVDSFTSKWLSIATTTTASYGYTGKRGSSCVPCNTDSMGSDAPSYLRYATRLTSQMSSRSLLLPVRLLAERDTGGYSFIGSIPRVFLSNACAKGYQPGSIYSWGSSNYRVFPGASAYPSFGYAIKQGI